MRLRWQRQIYVRAPVDAAFAYVADVNRHPEWAAQRLSVRQTSSGPIGLGTTFDSVGHQVGIDWKDAVRVSAFEPGRMLAYESRGGLGGYEHYFRLQPEGEGTRIFYGVYLLKPALFLLPPGPFLWAYVPIALGGDLRRIKARLEQPSNVSAG